MNTGGSDGSAKKDGRDKGFALRTTFLDGSSCGAVGLVETGAIPAGTKTLAGVRGGGLGEAMDDEELEDAVVAVTEDRRLETVFEEAIVADEFAAFRVSSESLVGVAGPEFSFSFSLVVVALSDEGRSGSAAALLAAAADVISLDIG